MKKPTELDNFLAKNRISQKTWECAAIDWENLQGIAEDHENQLESLRDSAEFFARVIQRFPGVHSVRWRIKDKEHLLEKIIRKRAEGNEKYNDITPGNYFEKVTDLIGLRALHLFKDECFAIDQDLRNTWATTEKPTAYVREGDPEEMTRRFTDREFEVKKHPAGYRSVHYVCSTKPLRRQVFAEIQVRTIFEEGWSEIDHHTRYPNFSDDQLVSYFLTIFNRLAGSADEMGTFVKDLTNARQEFDNQLADATKKKEEALSAMDKVLADLDATKRQDADTKSKLASLQQEVAKLRGLPSPNSLVAQNARNVALQVFSSARQKNSPVAVSLRSPKISDRPRFGLRSNPPLTTPDTESPNRNLAPGEISKVEPDSEQGLNSPE